MFKTNLSKYVSKSKDSVTFFVIYLSLIDAFSNICDKMARSKELSWPSLHILLPIFETKPDNSSFSTILNANSFILYPSFA